MVFISLSLNGISYLLKKGKFGETERVLDDQAMKTVSEYNELGYAPEIFGLINCNSPSRLQRFIF